MYIEPIKQDLEDQQLKQEYQKLKNEVHENETNIQLLQRKNIDMVRNMKILMEKRRMLQEDIKQLTDRILHIHKKKTNNSSESLQQCKTFVANTSCHNMILQSQDDITEQIMSNDYAAVSIQSEDDGNAKDFKCDKIQNETINENSKEQWKNLQNNTKDGHRSSNNSINIVDDFANDMHVNDHLERGDMKINDVPNCIFLTGTDTILNNTETSYINENTILTKKDITTFLKHSTKAIPCSKNYIKNVDVNYTQRSILKNNDEHISDCIVPQMLEQKKLKTLDEHNFIHRPKLSTTLSKIVYTLSILVAILAIPYVYHDSIVWEYIRNFFHEMLLSFRQISSERKILMRKTDYEKSFSTYQLNNIWKRLIRMAYDK